MIGKAMQTANQPFVPGNRLVAKSTGRHLPGQHAELTINPISARLRRHDDELCESRIRADSVTMQWHYLRIAAVGDDCSTAEQKTVSSNVCFPANPPRVFAIEAGRHHALSECLVRAASGHPPQSQRTMARCPKVA